MPGPYFSVFFVCLEIEKNFFHDFSYDFWNFKDFNEEIEKHRKTSEEQKAAAKKKIDELNSDLDQAR